MANQLKKPESTNGSAMMMGMAKMVNSTMKAWNAALFFSAGGGMEVSVVVDGDITNFAARE